MLPQEAIRLREKKCAEEVLAVSLGPKQCQVGVASALLQLEALWSCWYHAGACMPAFRCIGLLNKVLLNSVSIRICLWTCLGADAHRLTDRIS